MILTTGRMVILFSYLTFKFWIPCPTNDALFFSPGPLGQGEIVVCANDAHWKACRTFKYELINIRTIYFRWHNLLTYSIYVLQEKKVFWDQILWWRWRYKSRGVRITECFFFLLLLLQLIVMGPVDSKDWICLKIRLLCSRNHWSWCSCRCCSSRFSSVEKFVLVDLVKLHQVDIIAEMFPL